jgi:hypothetical protein
MSVSRGVRRIRCPSSRCTASKHAKVERSVQSNKVSIISQHNDPLVALLRLDEFRFFGAYLGRSKLGQHLIKVVAPNKLDGDHGGAPQFLQVIADKSKRRLQGFRI